MNETIKTVIGVLLPLVGTGVGAAMVFFLKQRMGCGIQQLLLGFASGVMIAASVWSLLLPAFDMSGGWAEPTFGFLFGVVFLLLLDGITQRLHVRSGNMEKESDQAKRSRLLVLSVTLHNIPEGMAVGVAFAGAAAGKHAMSVAAAFVLAVGITIQNIPEGAIISMPLVGEKTKKSKAFIYGLLSGVVEPLGAAVTLLMTSLITPILPFLLAFAAGAMICVVVEELIPETQRVACGKKGTLAVAGGFALMMLLDVALG